MTKYESTEVNSEITPGGTYLCEAVIGEFNWGYQLCLDVADYILIDWIHDGAIHFACPEHAPEPAKLISDMSEGDFDLIKWLGGPSYDEHVIQALSGATDRFYFGADPNGEII